jgi:hypothetical protein
MRQLGDNGMNTGRFLEYSVTPIVLNSMDGATWQLLAPQILA